MIRLKLYRIKNGISSENFAKKLGITYVYLSNIESGKVKPSTHLAEKILLETGDTQSDFRLLDKYPSTKNMKFEEFYELSRELGYHINMDLFEEVR